MTVRELLEILQATDPDAEVRLAIRAHTPGPMPMVPSEFQTWSVVADPDTGVVYIAEDGKAPAHGILPHGVRERLDGPGWNP